MIKLLLWVGRVGGLAGAALTVVAVASRVMGYWRIGDLQVGTLLQGGIAVMVLGALAYAAVAAESRGG